MEKEFVPYELAVKLKALGFDEPCFGFYEHTKKLNIKITKDSLCNKVKGLFCDAPTFSQALRWFREKYGITHRLYENFNFVILKIKGAEMIDTTGWYKTYEEAELACLDKLIEIVESKSE
jgi:hypothetical protein